MSIKISYSDIDYFGEAKASHLVKAQQLMRMSNDITNHTLRSRAFSTLITSNEHFDVIVMEVFLNEAMVGLSHLFGAPIVGYSTIGTTKSTSDMVGSPSPLSYIPHCMLPFTEEMNFVQRTYNTMITVFETIFFHFAYMPLHERLYNDIFPDPKPTLSVARTNNVSLVLLNTHFSLSYPRPYMVNMIEVGGMHVSRTPNKLPDKIQRFLDNAKDGAVLFSMGSIAKTSHLPPEKRQIFLQVFAGLKQRVLWKWDESDLPGRPTNVMISKWLPQEDILAHPNVILFISHAGLLSMTESIYHGVPMVGIPLGSDQNLNMARAERAGHGVKVNFINLTTESLDWAVREVLGDTK